MTADMSLWLAALLTVLGAILSTLHLSLANASKAKLAEIAESRAGGVGTVSPSMTKIIEDLPGHARAVALPRLLCNFLVVVFVLWYVHKIDSPDELSLVHAGIAVLVSGLILWFVSVVVPMSIATHVGERVVHSAARTVRLVHFLVAPLQPVAHLVDEIVRRLAGKEPTTEGEQLEAELLSVIDEGKREGQLDEDEQRMLEAVVQLRDKTVEQIMTPRTEILAMEYTDDLGAVTAIIRKMGHSRIPVYKDNLDNIIGIFYVKDLMRWLAGGVSRAGSSAAGGTGGAGKAFELKSILRPPLFVPETKTARELMHELLDKKVHIAMVADEYGGTAGLVTIEDVVETVFGDIYDEYEPQSEEDDKVEVSVEDRTALVDARAYIAEVNEALTPLGVAIPEGNDYDTVGGYVITTMGRIPRAGDSFRQDDLVVTVVEASPTRVLRVRLEVRPIAAHATEHADEVRVSTTDSVGTPAAHASK